MNVIQRAIEKLGSGANLARAVQVAPQVLNGWIKRGRVPDHMVWTFCRATGFMPWEVRPDLYDRPEGYLAKVSQLVTTSNGA